MNPVGVLQDVWHSVRDSIRNIIRVGSQKFTVMLIPHSEKKIFNFKVSIFSIIFFCFVFCGIFGAFVIFSTQFSGMSSLLTNRTESLEETENKLVMLLDEVENLSRSFNVLAASVNSTFETIGLDSDNVLAGAGEQGDLADVLGESVQPAGLSAQLNLLQVYADNMESIAEHLDSINRYLQNESELLTLIPNIWPVLDSRSYVTHTFNLREDPFTKVVYFHKGFDIACYNQQGIPIVATADGKVVMKKNDELGGYGNIVEIQHEYMFRTRYAHMQDNVRVNEGDLVKQGDIIGYMGNTGRSTAPHLHYEVRIGSEVVDPEYFLNMNSENRMSSDSRDRY